MRTTKATIPIVLGVLLALVLPTDAHAVRLSVGSVVVPRDATSVTVPISLSEKEGVVGYSVVVRYDPRYLAITDIRGIEAAADFSVVINIDSPGIARLTGLDLDLEGLASGSGAVAARVVVPIPPGPKRTIRCPNSFVSSPNITRLPVCDLVFGFAARRVGGALRAVSVI